MADEKLPPFTLDTSLELIERVMQAQTIYDLGVVGWWVYSYCSAHGERQEPVFTEGPPAEPMFPCRPCYLVGQKRSLQIEDIQRI